MPRVRRPASSTTTRRSPSIRAMPSRAARSSLTEPATLGIAFILLRCPAAGPRLSSASRNREMIHGWPVNGTRPEGPAYPAACTFRPRRENGVVGSVGPLRQWRRDAGRLIARSIDRLAHADKQPLRRVRLLDEIYTRRQLAALPDRLGGVTGSEQDRCLRVKRPRPLHQL